MKTKLTLIQDHVPLTFDERKGFGKAEKILTPEELLELFVSEMKLSYDYKTNSLKSVEEKVLPERTIISMLRLFALKTGHEFLKAFLIDAYRVWRDSKSNETLIKTREVLKHSSSDQAQVARFTLALTGSEDDLTIRVIEHFIWQVKRKLFGLPVEHHMLICLFGKSGAGKSVAIHKLLSPVFDIKLDSDFSIFSDRFSGNIWERNFVIFCDEMGEIKNTSVERLKNIITAPRVEARGMRSDQILSVKQNATFIAASNIELRDLINDPTSARRYYQIDCQDTIDWESINEIDYLSLWEAVDEDSPSPLVKVLDQVRAIQETSVRAKSNIEEFIEQCCSISVITKDSPTTHDLYKCFVSFCGLQGIRQYEGLQQFSRGLQRNSNTLRISSRKTSRGTTWGVSIKPV